ncbi:hypothetical protein [Streptomyces sp. NPDC086519]|uniref:hypothetical protein n=1 Tax=Streptomyces sp. NPDC086519 TaxID=3154863 RepID=UPI00341BAEB2
MGLKLIEQDLADARAASAGELMRGETTLILSAVDAVGRVAAERVYGVCLMRRALLLENGSRSSLMT